MKNRSSVVAAILQNTEILENAYNEALDSAGSATNELNTYLDSIQGRIDLFTNAVQTLWMNFINSDAVKFVIDLGTKIVSLIDKIGTMKVAVATLGGVVAFKKKNSISSFIEGLKSGTNSINQVAKATTTIQNVMKSGKASIEAYAAAVKLLSTVEQAQILTEQGLTQEQVKSILAKNNCANADIAAAAAANANKVAKEDLVTAEISSAFAAETVDAAKQKEILTSLGLVNADEQQILSKEALNIANLKALVVNKALSIEYATLIMKSLGYTDAEIAETLAIEANTTAKKLNKAASVKLGVGLTAVTLALTAGVSLWQKYKQKQEEARRSAEEAIQTYKDAQKTLKDNKSTIEEISEDYKRLSSGVDSFGNNISLTTDEYKRYNEITNKIADMFPRMVTGYTAEGNAIIATKGNVEELTKAYEAQAKAARDAVILGANTVFKTASEDAESLEKQAKAYEAAIAMANGTSTKDALSKYGDTIRNEAVKILEGIGFEAYNGTYASGTQYKSYGLKQKYNSVTGEYEDISTDKEKEEHAQRMNILLLQRNRIIGEQETNLQKVNTVLQAYLGNDAKYTSMTDELRIAVNSIVSSLDPADFDYDDEKMYAFINSNIVQPIYENKGNVQDALTSILDIDTTKVSYDSYKVLKDNLANSIKDLPKESQDAINKIFSKDSEQYKKYANHAAKILQEEFKDNINKLSLSDLKIAGELEVPDGVTYSWTELLTEIQKVKTLTGEDILQVKTYEALSESITNFNDILKQTEEVVLDNTEVTQEYKDSLIALVGSEEKVNECFYDNNKLVVKNAKQLNALVKSTKNNVANNIKLAKSQAQINYYNLYKQLRQLTNGQKIEDIATLNHINSLYKEMGAVQKTIAKYSLLEQQLSDVIQTYNEFDEAQTIDSDHDYMTKVETMITSLIQAYETGDLGTETAQVAMGALIPDFVFEDSGVKTVEDKAKAAHDYIMETLNKYFVLDFDEDTGEIQSTEMKLGNLRKFIEDGMIDNKVFAGSDWQHFEFSDKFLNGLDEADDKLKYFADQMGVTKEVALAAIQEINNKDIEWLNGDYGSLFDQIVPQTLDSRLQNTTSKLAELNVQLANGKITQEQYEAAVGGLNAQLSNGTITQDQYNTKIAELNKQLSDGKITQEEYTRQVSGLNGQLVEQKTNAANACTAFMSLNDKIDESQKKIEKYQKQLSSGTDENGNKLTDEQIDEINQQYQKELKNYESYIKQKKDLEDKYGAMTEYTVRIALEENGIDVDNIDSELSKTKDDINNGIKKLNDSLDGLEVSINDDGEIEYRITDKTEESQLNHLKELGALNEDGTVNIDLLYSGLTDEQKSEVDNLKTLQEKLNLINYYLGMDGVDTVQTSIDKLTETLENIYKLLETSPIFKAKVEPETKTALDNLLDKAREWAKNWIAKFTSNETKTVEYKYITTPTSTSNSGQNLMYADGTAHATGAVRKSGDWGLKNNEKDALVGELGEEIIVNPRTSKYYTVGTNGAELVDIPKGSIIFNHKQTEELFKNGHINSRGKAYVNGTAHAEGNAHVTIYPNQTVKSQWAGTGYSSWDDATYDAADALQNSASSINDAADSLSNSADDVSDAFEDTINWIEVLFTRIDDVLSEHEAYLATIIDSTGGLSTKNSIYDTMFSQMYYKANSSLQAAEYYRAKAEQEMVGLSADIQNKIRNGTISIQEFKGTGNEDADKALEEHVNKINQAIEYYDQISQYMQQYYSTLEEVADKALERQEETANAYENEIGLVEHLNNTLEARNDLLATKEGFAAEAYYRAQINASNTMLKQYKAERKALQQIFDAEVAAGNVKIGSQQWFDMQNAIYECDDAIIDMESSIEDLQNAINDLYWDRFDELINRFGYLEDELNNVIELLSHDPDGLIMEELRDLTTTNWATGSGLASLGLYAQQMEEAQYVANQYAEQIKELKKQYAAGRYNETEYLNKLNELISAQYENIEKYYDAKDAIVELNEARVDAIKTGLQEEIDKYDELISKKKELLNREQD